MENKETTKKDFTTEDYLIQILGYLGKNVYGLKFTKGELFSMCVVSIVELKTKLINKETHTKQLNKQIRNLSQMDAFKDILKSLPSDKR